MKAFLVMLLALSAHPTNNLFRTAETEENLFRPPVNLLTETRGYTYTFGPNIRVNPNIDGTVNPRITLDRDGNIYVAYNMPGNPRANFVCSKSIDGGHTFGAPVRINTLQQAYYWGSTDITTDTFGNIYAVWEDLRAGFNIYFAKSIDGGETFTGERKVTSNSVNALNVSITTDEAGNIYATWSGLKGGQYDVFFSKSTNGGVDWSFAVQVNNTPMQDDATSIAVADNGDIYVAWNTFGLGDWFAGDIYVAKSTDGGLSFGTPVRVNDTRYRARVWDPNFIATHGNNNFYLVWTDRTIDDEGDVYFDRSTDGGMSFGTDVRVNDVTHRWQEDPSMVVDTLGNIYLVWQDLRSNSATEGYDIYFAFSTDSGRTFSPNVKVNDDALGNQMNPTIAVSPDRTVFCTWRDARANPSFDIYFARAMFPATTHDVATISIDEPIFHCWPGKTITPEATIRNIGGITAYNFDVRYKIGDGYNESIHIDSLIGGRSATLRFPEWSIPWTPETYELTVSHTLLDDDTLNNILIDVTRASYWIIYDDNVSEAGYAVGTLDNDKFALRFTPVDSPYTVDSISAFIDYSPYADRITGWDYVMICPDDGTGNPDTLNPYGIGGWLGGIGDNRWYFVEISTPLIHSRDDIWLILHWPDTTTNMCYIGTDIPSFAENRSAWYNDDRGYWTHMTGGNWMARIHTTPERPGIEETSDLSSQISKPELQVCPNPFRGQTVISYRLPVVGTGLVPVRLKIYDVSGGLVKRLVDEKVSAGHHSVDFDGRNLPSGIYFARLTAGDYNATRKLILMR